MNERSAIPLAIAIMGMILSVLSYAVPDENFGRVAYGSGLLSAVLSLVHWFITPTPGRR